MTWSLGAALVHFARRPANALYGVVAWLPEVLEWLHAKIGCRLADQRLDTLNPKKLKGSPHA